MSSGRPTRPGSRRSTRRRREQLGRDELERRQRAEVSARLPGRRALVVDAEVGEEFGEALDHDRELQPGEVRAQAEVTAVAEGDVPVRVAVEDATLGLVERARVVVRGSVG